MSSEMQTITLKEYINNRLQKKGYKFDNIAKVVIRKEQRDERDHAYYTLKYIECEPFLKIANELLLPLDYAYEYINRDMYIVMDDGSVFNLYKCEYIQAIKSPYTVYDIISVSSIVGEDEYSVRTKGSDIFDKDLFYRKAYLKSFLTTTPLIKDCRMRNFAEFDKFYIKNNDDFFYIHNLGDDCSYALVLRPIDTYKEQVAGALGGRIKKTLQKIADNNYKYNIFYQKDNEFIIIDKFNNED